MNRNLQAENAGVLCAMGHEMTKTAGIGGALVDTGLGALVGTGIGAAYGAIDDEKDIAEAMKEGAAYGAGSAAGIHLLKGMYNFGKRVANRAKMSGHAEEVQKLDDMATDALAALDNLDKEMGWA